MFYVTKYSLIIAVGVNITVNCFFETKLHLWGSLSWVGGGVQLKKILWQSKGTGSLIVNLTWTA